MEFAAFFTGVVLLWLGAALVVSCLRLTSLTACALALYVVSCAELVVLAELLSPFHAVTTAGYLIGEWVIAAGAASVWLYLGRPRPPRIPWYRLRGLSGHRLILILAGAVMAALAYELFLGVFTPPNNWDALWYHLARVAAWRQHHAVTYIHPVNTQLLNSYPPNAEIQVLFGVVLLGRDTFATIPQFLAELAVLVSIFGIARRVGFAFAGSVFAALLFATFSIVALESVTAQNDLCVAACVAAAAFFVLDSSRRADLVLAGAAVGIAVGTKFTGIFALPLIALIALASQRRWRPRLELAAWSLGGTALLGAYGYAMNLWQTGHLSGAEQDTIRAHVSPLSTVSTAARTLYRFIDLSGWQHILHHRSDTTVIFAVLLAIALAVLVVAFRQGRLNQSRLLTPLTAAAIVVLVPLSTMVVAGVGRLLMLGAHVPLNPHGATQNAFDFLVNGRAHEGLSYFGPLGLFLVWPMSVFVCIRYARGRSDRRLAALAASLPLFLLVVATGVRYSLWLGRFFIVPVALVMPLCALLYRNRLLATWVTAIGLTGLALTQAFDEGKPTGLAGSRAIWSLSRADAQSLEQPAVRPVLEAISNTVPPRARVGLFIRPKDWSYPFYGQTLGRTVTFLPRPLSMDGAAVRGFSFVIEHRQHQNWYVGKVSGVSQFQTTTLASH